MDDIERAQEQEQKDRARALSAQRQRTVLPDIGQCYNCEASVPPGAHFCDADCRADYERQESANKRNGRAIWSDK